MDPQRAKAYERRRAELAKLTDAQLKERFWQLCNRVVEPLVTMAQGHTSPSIERSVLLRMGIDSVTAAGVVAKIAEAGLLGKGAGHCLLKVAQRDRIDVRAAAKKIDADPKTLAGLFGGG